MSRAIRALVYLLLAGLILGTAPAQAGIPSPANHECPRHILLVGSAGGVVDQAGDFVVTVRDIANIPIYNALIVVDFSSCSGLRLCTSSVPGLTVDCGTQTVRGFTDWNGSVHFRIRGHAETNCNDGPWQPPQCARIYSDGIFLCSPDVAAVDLNGGGMNPADLKAWLCDFFFGDPGSPALRSDYDGSGELGPGDLSAWLDVFFQIPPATGSHDNCPLDGTSQCPIIP